jgi:hypothetical protein
MKVKGNNGGDFQRPDPGTYLARCVKVIDLGTQTGEYQGSPTIRRQVVLGWELPTELIPTGDYAGEPFMVTKFYTASLNEKATLRHDLENWRTKPFTDDELAGFDLANILGKACLITITTNENGKSKVTGVTAPPRGTSVPKQINEPVNFSLEPDEFDPAVYQSLSDWFRETIAQSPEYAEIMSGPAPVPSAGSLDGDSIPF